MHIQRVIQLLIFPLVFSACTASLWQQPAYNEQITNFYMNETGSKRLLVAQGKDFAYIFENINGNLWAALSNSQSISFSPWVKDWNLEADSSVHGVLILYVSKSKLNPKQELFLLDHGFIDKYPNQSVLAGLELKTLLTGKRISNTRESKTQPLKDPIYLRIKRPRTSEDVVSNAALTPAGLLYDGTILPIVVVVWGVAAASNSLGGHNE